MRRFKQPEMELELARIHPMLKEVLTDLEFVWGRELFITSVERKAGEAGKMGAHSPHTARPCRGTDIRTRNVAKDDVEYAAAYINRRWAYDPVRPKKVVALIESDHLHMQVHDNTRRRTVPEMA